MRLPLKLHPATPCEAVTGIEGEATRPGPGRLLVSYRVTGTMADIVWPTQALHARTDALWQHTCFEVFLRMPLSAGYFEFNFAPSTEWAAYSFDGYREGMRVVQEIGTPRIVTRSSDRAFELQALVDWEGLPEGALWQLGLSAVIEEKSGRKSYWALTHPAAKPDFHHADTFALELPGPSKQS